MDRSWGVSVWVSSVVRMIRKERMGFVIFHAVSGRR